MLLSKLVGFWSVSISSKQKTNCNFSVPVSEAMNVYIFSAPYVVFDEKLRPEEPNWDDSKVDLTTLWHQQLQYNRFSFIKLTDNPTSSKIYENMDWIDAYDDVLGMDTHIPLWDDHRYTVMITDNGRYQGHVYIHHVPDEKTIHMIGIRGRPDKFVSGESKGIGLKLVNAVKEYAEDNKIEQVVTIYPRDNFVAMIKHWGFVPLSGCKFAMKMFNVKREGPSDVCYIFSCAKDAYACFT
jgi:hypothetical protein